MTSTPQASSNPGEGATVAGTPAAVAMVQRLVELHGPLSIFLSGGCCDGSTPICVAAEDLPAGRYDVRLGELAGAPIYIDDEQHRRWGHPHFMLDVAAGAPEGMSLGLKNAHLISGPPAEL